jgi:hypothetical protein
LIVMWVRNLIRNQIPPSRCRSESTQSAVKNCVPQGSD